MADYTATMTGTLKLEKITPLIKALFEPFGLNGQGDPTRPYVRKHDGDVSWANVSKSLRQYAENRGIPVGGDEDDHAHVLRCVGAHLLNGENKEFLGLIGHIDFDRDPELGDLIELATYFDDGHGLYGCDTKTGYQCDLPRLDGFGGHGDFIGKHFAITTGSHQASALGEKMDAAIDSGNVDEAAQTLRRYIRDFASGIADAAVREQVLQELGLSGAALEKTSFSLEDRLDRVKSDVAFLREESLDPFSIPVSDEVDVEIRPNSEDDRVDVYRKDWGGTCVNYTFEGLILDVHEEGAMDSYFTQSIPSDDLMAHEPEEDDGPAEQASGV